MSDVAEDVLSSSEAGGRVIRGSAVRVAANAAGIVVGLLTATLLLHHLGVAESGRYVTVLSLVAIAAGVVDLGLNVSGSRELALCGSEGRAALRGRAQPERTLSHAGPRRSICPVPRRAAYVPRDVWAE